jgi:hypothetical protein
MHATLFHVPALCKEDDGRRGVQRADLRVAHRSAVSVSDAAPRRSWAAGASMTGSSAQAHKQRNQLSTGRERLPRAYSASHSQIRLQEVWPRPTRKSAGQLRDSISLSLVRCCLHESCDAPLVSWLLSRPRPPCLARRRG